MKLIITSDLDKVWLIGVSVRAVLAEASCSEETSFNVELAVVEAVNNAIEHAYQNEPDHEVEVILALGAQNVEVRVTDRGRPIPTGTLEQARQLTFADPADLADSGRGLAIIQQIMDQVTYRTAEGANTLGMTKAWQPKQAELVSWGAY